MALGTDHIINADYPNFIPELWSDEVIAAYKQNLVMANLVNRMNHKGKKGDTIHIPKPSRGSANVKVAETQVTLNNPSSTVQNVSIDKHFEYSNLIEDITEVQALDSLRKFYTDDAGYALARQVDIDLHSLGADLGGGTAYSAAVIGGDGTTVWDPTASGNAGNGAALTDAGIRKMIQTLDDADVPMDSRYLVIPPVERNTLLGIDKFVRADAVGESAKGNSIRSGMIGEIYGIPVYISSNCPVVVADDTSTNYRVGMLFHKDAFVLVDQMSIRSQTQYKQEYLANLYTSDMLYGTAEIREESAVAFIVPA